MQASKISTKNSYLRTSFSKGGRVEMPFLTEQVLGRKIFTRAGQNRCSEFVGFYTGAGKTPGCKRLVGVKASWRSDLLVGSRSMQTSTVKNSLHKRLWMYKPRGACFLRLKSLLLEKNVGAKPVECRSPWCKAFVPKLGAKMGGIVSEKKRCGTKPFGCKSLLPWTVCWPFCVGLCLWCRNLLS